MDIESKKFRIKSGLGGYVITNKSTNKTRYVSSVPSVHELAMMHERTFDKTMAELFNSN